MPYTRPGATPYSLPIIGILLRAISQLLPLPRRLDAVTMLIEPGLLRADEQREHERQHIQRSIGPTHTAIADGRQQYGRDTGAGECGETAARLYADNAAPCLPSPAYSVMMVGNDEKAQVPMPTMIAAIIIISAFAHRTSRQVRRQTTRRMPRTSRIR